MHLKRFIRRAESTTERSRGQSLVEMALVMPILLLMLLGVLEVGWALRGYLVLANANREATRFAARGRYLDFNQTTPETIGYDLVVSHTLDSLAGQLPLDLGAASVNGGAIISHYVVDTGQPCQAMDACVCSADPADFDGDNAGNLADWGDKFQGPGPSWDNTDRWRYYSRADLVSRLDDAALRTRLTNENNVFNCQLYKKDPSAPWSINSVVIVELFYYQPQLLGIFDTQSFLGAAIIPNPVPFYTQTTMRITADARSGGRSGASAGCAVWPIALHTQSLVVLGGGATFNVYNGSGSGNFGWLRWPPATSAANEGYLVQSLYDAMMSTTDFENAREAGDTALDVGDWVWGNTVLSDGQDARDVMDYLVSLSYIRVPVWDTASGTGTNANYHIVGFALIQVTSYQLPGQNAIWGQFLQWDNECNGPGA